MRLFLTSSVEIPGVADDIYQKLGGKPIKLPFIYTPADAPSERDDLTWLDGERKMLRASGFEIFDYNITGKSSSDLQDDLADIDGLYVSGGNEFYFKQEASKCGFGQFVQEFVNSGKPYIGTSAGSIIMGQDMLPTIQLSDLNDLDDPEDVDTKGFGIVDFTILPHWGSEDFKERYFAERLRNIYHPDFQLIPLNNNQYVEVKDDWYRIVDISK